MKLVSFLHTSYLLALGCNQQDAAFKRFYVDGNNLLGAKGSPKQREAVAQKLMPVQGTEIVLVFDGNKDGEKERVAGRYYLYTNITR
jgi:hypothetical protein